MLVVVSKAQRVKISPEMMKHYHPLVLNCPLPGVQYTLMDQPLET